MINELFTRETKRLFAFFIVILFKQSNGTTIEQRYSMRLSVNERDKIRTLCLRASVSYRKTISEIALNPSSVPETKHNSNRKSIVFFVRRCRFVFFGFIPRVRFDGYDIPKTISSTARRLI